MSVIVNSPPYPMSRGLHVLFLAGGNGRAAQLAGHWARALGGGYLQVEAADFDGMESALDLNGEQASLVVVIHAAGDPEPLVAHNSGGRIDWHLEGHAIADCQFELTAQLRRHVTRLLGDLGIPQIRSEVRAIQLTDPSLRLDLPIPVLASTCPQGIRAQSSVRAAWLVEEFEVAPSGGRAEKTPSLRGRSELAAATSSCVPFSQFHGTITRR